MACCATGPCDAATGDPEKPGCYLCDVIAKLPQQKAKSDLQKNDRPTLKGMK